MTDHEHQESEMSKAAWQSQALEVPTISLAFIHHQIARMNAESRKEALLMYVSVALFAAVGTVPFFPSTWTATSGIGPLTRIVVVLGLLGFAYVLIEVRRRSKAILTPPEESVTGSLHAYRMQLERRRDYYRDSWRWSLLPITPCLALFLVGGLWFDQRPHALIRYGALGIFIVVFTALGFFDHRRRANALDQELTAVDTMHRPASKPSV